jgi:hypothetical protein
MNTSRILTPAPSQSSLHFRCIALDPAINGGVIENHAAFSQHLLQLTIADAVFAVLVHRPKDDVSLKTQAFK